MRAIDDPNQAPGIVERWSVGSASTSESALLDVISNVDETLRERMRVGFPALVAAWEAWCRR